MTPDEAAEAYWLGSLRTEDLVPIATSWVANGSADDAVVAAASVRVGADPRDVRRHSSLRWNRLARGSRRVGSH